MRGGRSATRLEVELPSHGRAMPFAPPDEVMSYTVQLHDLTSTSSPVREHHNKQSTANTHLDGRVCATVCVRVSV